MLRYSFIPALVLLALQGEAQEIFEVTRLVISPAGEDYSPVPLDGGFVMCSVRESQTAIAFRDASSAKPLSDLYWVPYKNGQNGTPVLFSTALTTPVNEGPAAFCNGGRTICYTRNITVPKDRNSRKNGSGQLGLYFSDLVDGVWREPVPFAYNSQKHSIMHPSFSTSGDTLFFASDMAGGQGGMDLYYSIRDGQGWSEPKDLGIEVNSTYNEAYPRIQIDGTLHFASDRPGGLGKLDIYQTLRVDQDWETVMPLPAPLNSPANDFGYSHISGHTALMSSDRDGMDAIYLAKRTVPKFRDCSPQVKNNYCFAFKTRKHAAMNSLPLDHVWDLGDGTRITGLLAEHCFEQAGTYTVRSMLVDRKSQSVFHILKTQELVVEDRIQAYVASPDTIRTGRNMIMDPRLSKLGGMEAAEYHWDLGDGTVMEGAKVQYAYRAPGTYTVRLDILSTPDAQGRIHNMCSTKDIHVIDKYREHEDMTITAIYQDAFGKTHSYEYQELPFDAFALAADELADVKFSVELFASRERISLDDPRFMEINKFYRVVEQFDPKRGTYVYSVGETTDIEELYKIFQKVKELDFMDAEVHVLKEEKIIDLSELRTRQSKELDRSKLRLDNIHFAYKSAKLQESSLDVIDQIVELLSKYDDLQLVIEAHTDDIGSGPYNMELSQLRANSVVEHFIGKGFDTDRFVAVGHGKNQPIASNRTEEGRSMNRRVEFRMSFLGLQGQAFIQEP